MRSCGLNLVENGLRQMIVTPSFNPFVLYPTHPICAPKKCHNWVYPASNVVEKNIVQPMRTSSKVVFMAVLKYHGQKNAGEPIPAPMAKTESLPCDVQFC
jgi:hypothetical protein